MNPIKEKNGYIHTHKQPILYVQLSHTIGHVDTEYLTKNENGNDMSV